LQLAELGPRPAEASAEEHLEFKLASKMYRGLICTKKSDSASTANLLRAIADAQLQPSTDVDAEDEGHAMALKSERHIEGLH
jgi:hypothetical protein